MITKVHSFHETYLHRGALHPPIKKGGRSRLSRLAA
jgi:hypothetical protein